MNQKPKQLFKKLVRYLTPALLTMTTTLTFANNINQNQSEIRVLNLRSVVYRQGGVPVASNNDYQQLFQQLQSLNQSGDQKHPYDFIGAEAYGMNQDCNRSDSKDVTSPLIKSNLSNLYSQNQYIVMGRCRSNGGSPAEATPIIYNKSQWTLVNDPTVEQQIQNNCNQIKINNQAVAPSVDRQSLNQDNAENGDPSISPIHTCQLSTAAVHYDGDYFGGSGNFGRIATWGVFERNNNTNKKVIVIVSHFPLPVGGPGGKQMGNNIEKQIITPLRNAYPDAPVIFIGAFNGQHPDIFDGAQQADTRTICEQGAGCDGNSKINYLSNKNGQQLSIMGTPSIIKRLDRYYKVSI